jgi:hypothetical protein
VDRPRRRGDAERVLDHRARLDVTTYTDFDERYTVGSTIRGSLKLLATKLGMRRA